MIFRNLGKLIVIPYLEVLDGMEQTKKVMEQSLLAEKYLTILN